MIFLRWWEQWVSVEWTHIHIEEIKKMNSAASLHLQLCFSFQECSFRAFCIQATTLLRKRPSWSPTLGFCRLFGQVLVISLSVPQTLDPGSSRPLDDKHWQNKRRCSQWAGTAQGLPYVIQGTLWDMLRFFSDMLLISGPGSFRNELQALWRMLLVLEDVFRRVTLTSNSSWSNTPSSSCCNFPLVQKVKKAVWCNQAYYHYHYLQGYNSVTLKTEALCYKLCCGVAYHHPIKIMVTNVEHMIFRLKAKKRTIILIGWWCVNQTERNNERHEQVALWEMEHPSILGVRILYLDNNFLLCLTKPPTSWSCSSTQEGPVITVHLLSQTRSTLYPRNASSSQRWL